MKKKLLSATGSALILAFLVVLTISARAILEVEPNDNPGQANPLNDYENMIGSISPGSDLDYYSILGKSSPYWGFIALADSYNSTVGKNIVLTAFRSDGVTEMQSSAGSWERGAGIALQKYADGSNNHYLQVSEQGGDEEISHYSLRSFPTVIEPKDEIEPNDTRLNGTSSSFTMKGAFSAAGDKDCYRFHGETGQGIVLAVETTNPTSDTILELIGPNDAVLESANTSSAGGNEFILYNNLPATGVYAYCVGGTASVTGSATDYKVGIVRQTGLYYPPYTFQVNFLNGGPGGTAITGSTMSFQLVIKNDSLVTIPGPVSLSVSYKPECLSYQNANPAPISSTAGSVVWPVLMDGLAPGESYEVKLNMAAAAVCEDYLSGWYALEYFLTGGGENVPYKITPSAGVAYLPVMMRVK